MLNTREWQPTLSDMPWRAPGYAFFVDPPASMTSVAISSEDFGVTASTSENFEWIRPDQQVARVLVELFKDIPQVKSICAQFGSDEIVVWTLLETYDRDAREKVYEKELEVCRLLRIHNFDFRVTSAELVPPEDLTATGSREIYRRS